MGKLFCARLNKRADLETELENLRDKRDELERECDELNGFVSATKRDLDKAIERNAGQTLTQTLTLTEDYNKTRGPGQSPKAGLADRKDIL